MMLKNGNGNSGHDIAEENVNENSGYDEANEKR
jgi:hypothetical protein